MLTKKRVFIVVATLAIIGACVSSQSDDPPTVSSPAAPTTSGATATLTVPEPILPPTSVSHSPTPTLIPTETPPPTPTRQVSATATYTHAPSSTATSVSHSPTPTPSPVPASTHNCRDSYGYDRSNWPYVRGNPGHLRWTTEADSVNSWEPTLDHHVALKDAYLSGGCLWTGEEKRAFSNDALNHFWTTRSFNSSKGARTPDRLTGIAKRIIDTPAERCAYATRHRDIKAKYRLSMTPAEQATVSQWLAHC